jgi:SSS family solute:Na+ symporter
MPDYINLEPLYKFGFADKNGAGVYEMPFIDRMGFVFLICVVGMYIISMIENADGKKVHGLEVDASMFKTSRGFAVGTLIVGGILVALYSMFW